MHTICNQAHRALDVKLSACSATMPGLLQATAVCGIAWQQALPEARVETDSAYSTVCDNKAQRMTDEHQALHHKKSWPPTQKR